MQPNLFLQGSNFKFLVNQINLLEDHIKKLTDNELQLKGFKLRKKYKNTQDLDQILVESFALTREASLRVLGLRHFDSQLLGGLALNNQKIAEIETGEGKTLIATLPAFLNALSQKGVHIVTVNDYLAKRDQLSMGNIYKFLGLKTGLVQENMSRIKRKNNYKADITYVTNTELVFDFLRDNLVFNVNDVVLRPFNYCILDEADSILIDEAQTPLVISNQTKGYSNKCIVAAEIVNYLTPNLDYFIDEKENSVILTEHGNKQIEKILHIQNLYDSTDSWVPYIISAIKSNTYFFKNIHYVLKNDKITIVHIPTGRVLPEHNWETELHQAIQAKEKIKIQPKKNLVASITYQNFFLLYPKISGMTGTASTSKVEFKKFYGLSIEKIPPVRVNLRNDLPDLVYKDQTTKWNAVAEICKKIHKRGQPLLVGTTTINKSEKLAKLLKFHRLPYRILNAKPENARLEAEIIAQAGKIGAITIATNMAGRGTDIILGGNFNLIIKKNLYDILIFLRNSSFKKLKFYFISCFLKKDLQIISQKFLSILLLLRKTPEFLKLSDTAILKILESDNYSSLKVKPFIFSSIQILKNEFFSFYKNYQKQEKNIIKTLGGLYIIGTERNRSRRIDNQLRGRAGRQGDPGISRFFLSLEDNLLRIFGSMHIQRFIKTHIKNISLLESKILNENLNLAQSHIEEQDYSHRKNLVVFDEILNNQRNHIFFERNCILKKAITHENILILGELFITDLLSVIKKKELSNKKIILALETLFGRNLTLKRLKKPITDKFNFIELKTYLFQEFWLAYKLKRNELKIYGNGIYENIERSILLLNIDKIWQEHLQKMVFLRETTNWQNYNNKNTLLEYNTNGFNIFNFYSKLWYHLVIYDFFRLFLL